MPMTELSDDPEGADRLRDNVVDDLIADGTIVSKSVEAAMRKVLRIGSRPKRAWSGCTARMTPW
jgi:hypothetical protein